MTVIAMPVRPCSGLPALKPSTVFSRQALPIAPRIRSTTCAR